MLRRFGKKSAPQQVEGQTTNGYANGTIPANGTKQRITVNPKEDLFCLQPFVNYSLMVWSQLSIDVPILEMTGSPEYNLAFEFDPEWLLDLSTAYDALRRHFVTNNRYYDRYSNRNSGTLECIVLAACCCWAKTIWFIDYRISPAHRAGRLYLNDGCRHVFQGKDCKYVEVRAEDAAHWNMGHDTPDHSISRFVAEINKSLWLYRIPVTWLMHTHSPDSINPNHAAWLTMPKLGVLARVADD
ncbi:hypothetical protein F5B19DRAFT_458141 [Rostrohypoxylon terebratum]|nr:hypothetical protein F5B19DRAFT_458141 [Rostrohypoxylon terebratum]